jgi:hydroxymethylpyrimidine/phosphomethylpyrimidine kinase
MTARVLIIAGSDSGGGAGIQADIKTVTMLGGHAMTAITAVTAQNTVGVTAVHQIPTDVVIAQIDAVMSDIGVDAIKIGMIGSAETANAVADYLGKVNVPIVFDPVMVATSGSVLADPPTISAFERLMRIATLTTPNIPELRELSGMSVMNANSRAEAAKSLANRRGCAILSKGGHSRIKQICDILILPDGTWSNPWYSHILDAGNEKRWLDQKIPSIHTHGTGCTLASAIATGIGDGAPLEQAVERARRFVQLAILGAPELGKGHGPMGHQAVTMIRSSRAKSRDGDALGGVSTSLDANGGE